METRSFHRFLDQLGQLSKRQREKVLMHLEQTAKAEVAASIIEKASVEHLECPRCRGHDFYLHGRAHGLQRYKCKGCSRTFNGLTGTPLAHLWAKAKWLDFLDCMLDPATTVRKAARWVGVHKNTTFRWRRRFLTIPKTDRPACLHGIAEADEIYFLESEKGARHLIGRHASVEDQRPNGAFRTNRSAYWSHATEPGRPWIS